MRSVRTSEPISDTEIGSADFNHDGKPDLALTYAPDNRVIVMVNTTTPPGPCSDGPLYSIHLCSPASGATFLSPVHVSARANSDRTITSWKVYVDGVAKASGTGANIEISLPLGSFSFQRRITAKAWDASGASFSTSVLITVK
ncbi:MAG TPA: Ig-like domain-containing protein [Terriglobales bacterium]